LVNEREGVTKFHLDFRPGPAAPVEITEELSTWRDHFKKLGFIGQTPDRYEGLGFGNLSRRLSSDGRFLIAGTQTGNRDDLGPEHFSIVTASYPEENRLVAEGPVPPSSEAMTHGVIYETSPATRWIFHGHAPEIWRRAPELELPSTDASIPYGTPEMARAVKRLIQSGQLAKRPFFVMGGHEDGVVCFGESPRDLADCVNDILSLTR
jgi:L-ribulose-5-phosphate 4-epimerase